MSSKDIHNYEIISELGSNLPAMTDDEVARRVPQAASILLSALKKAKVDSSLEDFLYSVGNCIHDARFCRLCGSEVCSEIILELCDLMPRSQSKSVYLSCIWCLTVQNFDSTSIAKMATLIVTRLCEYFPKLMQSSTAHTLSLKVIDILLNAVEPEAMTNLGQFWWRIVFNSIVHPDDKVRNQAKAILIAGRSCLQGNHATIQRIAVESKEKTVDKMIALFNTDEAYVIELWAEVVVTLGDTLHRATPLVNALVKVIEKAARSRSDSSRSLALSVWRRFIDIFATNLDVLCNVKRLRFLLQPLEGVVLLTTDTAQSLIFTWWHLIVSVEDRLQANFSLLVEPLLKFCFPRNVGALDSSSLGCKTRRSVPDDVKVMLADFGAQILLLIFDANPDDDDGMYRVDFERKLEPLKREALCRRTAFCRHSEWLLASLVTATSEKMASRRKLILHVWHCAAVHVNEAGQDASRRQLVIKLASTFLQNVGLVTGQLADAAFAQELLELTVSVASLPRSILMSSVVNLNYKDPLQGTPCIFLLDLLLQENVLKNGCQQKFLEICTKLLSFSDVGQEVSVLDIVESVVERLEIALQHTGASSWAFVLWHHVAAELISYIVRTKDVNQGDNVEHDFSCVRATLLFPIQHLLSADVDLNTRKSLTKNWCQLYKAFATCAAAAAPPVSISDANSRFAVTVDWIAAAFHRFASGHNKNSCRGFVESVLELVSFMTLDLRWDNVDVVPELSNFRSTFDAAKEIPVCNLTPLLKLLSMLMKEFTTTTTATDNSSVTFLKIFVEQLSLLVVNLRGAALINAIVHLTPAIAQVLIFKIPDEQSSFHSQLDEFWRQLTRAIPAEHRGVYDNRLLEQFAQLFGVAIEHNRKPVRINCRQLWKRTFVAAYENLILPPALEIHPFFANDRRPSNDSSSSDPEKENNDDSRQNLSFGCAATSTPKCALIENSDNCPKVVSNRDVFDAGDTAIVDLSDKIEEFFLNHEYSPPPSNEHTEAAAARNELLAVDVEQSNCHPKINVNEIVEKSIPLEMDFQEDVSVILENLLENCTEREKSERCHRDDVGDQSARLITRHASILKRRLADEDSADDWLELSPRECKRRRVHFNHPVVTSSRLISPTPPKRARQSNKSGQKFGRNASGKPATPTKGIASDKDDGELLLSLASDPKMSASNNTDPIFPELMDCTDLLDTILHQISASVRTHGLKRVLTSRKILTIGDLSALTPANIVALPIKSPKIVGVRKALAAHLRSIGPNEGRNKTMTSTIRIAEIAETGNTRTAMPSKTTKTKVAAETSKERSAGKCSSNDDIDLILLDKSGEEVQFSTIMNYLDSSSADVAISIAGDLPEVGANRMEVEPSVATASEEHSTSSKLTSIAFAECPPSTRRESTTEDNETDERLKMALHDGQIEIERLEASTSNSEVRLVSPPSDSKELEDDEAEEPFTSSLPEEWTSVSSSSSSIQSECIDLEVSTEIGDHNEPLESSSAAEEILDGCEAVMDDEELLIPCAVLKVDQPNLANEFRPKLGDNSFYSDALDSPASEIVCIGIPSVDVPCADIPSADIPSADIPTKEIPSADIPSVDVPSAEIASADIPSADIPTKEIPSADIPSKEIRSADIPSADIPSADIPSADIPCKWITSADIPSKEIPSADIPSKEIRSADIPSADIPCKWITSADIPSKEIPSADIPSKEIRSADIPSADIPSADIPSADIPSKEIPSENIPSKEIPSADIPSADIPSKGITSADIPSKVITSADIPTKEIPSADIPSAEIPSAEIQLADIPSTDILSIKIDSINALDDMTMPGGKSSDGVEEQEEATIEIATDNTVVDTETQTDELDELPMNAGHNQIADYLERRVRYAVSRGIRHLPAADVLMLIQRINTPIFDAFKS